MLFMSVRDIQSAKNSRMSSGIKLDYKKVLCLHASSWGLAQVNLLPELYIGAMPSAHMEDHYKREPCKNLTATLL